MEALLNPPKREKIFAEAIKNLSGYSPLHMEAIQHSRLRVVFQRTLRFGQIRKKASEQVFYHRRVSDLLCNNVFFKPLQSFTAECPTCNSRPEEERCIQKILVKPQKMDQKYIGCGVSFAAPEDVVPMTVSIEYTLLYRFLISSSQSPRAINSGRSKLYTPKDLGLRRFAANLDVIERCGSQIYQLFDADKPDTMVSAH